MLCSRYVQKNGNDRSRLCFRFYSLSFIIVEPGVISGKGYWPHCDYDRITYKVDYQDVDYIPMRKNGGGSCENNLDISNSKFIQQLKNGNIMKLKTHWSKGSVSLKGFSDAFDYAINEFK